jgi:peptidoglycan/LPS O-acetylase OafA/YrhL
VACLLIVIYHSSRYAADKITAGGAQIGIGARIIFYLLGWMSIGVPMFFVISGYCVTAACDSLRTRPRAVGKYFYRRFRRIFPPFWVFLAATAIVVSLAYWAGFGQIYSDNLHGTAYGVPRPSQLTCAQWLGNLALIEIWRPKLFGGDMVFFQGHAWTLCYEEQFYATCGFILFLMPRHFFRGLTVLTIAVAALFVTTQVNRNYSITGFFFDGMWLLFAAGALIYFRFQHASAQLGRILDVLMVVAMVAVFAFSKFYPAKIPLMLKVALPFAVLLIALHRWDMPMISSRILRPVAWCGTMCYSLYLVHEPIV